MSTTLDRSQLETPQTKAQWAATDASRPSTTQIKSETAAASSIQALYRGRLARKDIGVETHNNDLKALGYGPDEIRRISAAIREAPKLEINYIERLAQNMESEPVTVMQSQPNGALLEVPSRCKPFIHQLEPGLGRTGYETLMRKRGGGISPVNSGYHKFTVKQAQEEEKAMKRAVKYTNQMADVGMQMAHVKKHQRKAERALHTNEHLVARRLGRASCPRQMQHFKSPCQLRAAAFSVSSPDRRQSENKPLGLTQPAGSQRSGGGSSRDNRRRGCGDGFSSSSDSESDDDESSRSQSKSPMFPPISPNGSKAGSIFGGKSSAGSIRSSQRDAVPEGKGLSLPPLSRGESAEESEDSSEDSDATSTGRSVDSSTCWQSDAPSTVGGVPPTTHRIYGTKGRYEFFTLLRERGGDTEKLRAEMEMGRAAMGSRAGRHKHVVTCTESGLLALPVVVRQANNGELMLKNYGMGDGIALGLADGLVGEDVDPLRAADISGCNLHKKGASKLIGALHKGHGSTLLSLIISDNFIGTAGCAAVTAHSTLKRLTCWLQAGALLSDKKVCIAKFSVSHNKLNSKSVTALLNGASTCLPSSCSLHDWLQAY